jgi:formylglycine-generating enzyme required for sulfatase activity
VKTDVSRADLLQYLSVADEDNLALIADCFGYQYTPTPPPIHYSYDDVIKCDITAGIEFGGSITSTFERPPEHFCRLTKITPSELVPFVAEDEEIPLPAFITETNQLDFLQADTRNKNAPPPPAPEPLVAWSRLWTVLRAILSEQQTKKRPDLAKLVKTIAYGHFPAKIPQQQRQNWTAECRILIDRPQRLRLFNHDYLQLIKQLKKLRGEVGLVQEMLEDAPGGNVLTGFGLQAQKKAWHKPEPETSLLILSDLGIYDASGQAEKQWLAFGRKLQAAGCKAYVLMPVPARLLSQELANLYQCISWDRFSTLTLVKGATAHAVEKNKQHDKARLNALLPWLSPLVELEPNLLRAIRHHLFDKPLTVSFEALLWNHEDTISNTTYLTVSAEKALAHRDSFMQQAEQNKDQAVRLYNLVKRYHAHKFLIDYYEEVNLIAHAADCVDEVLNEAINYLQQFVKAVHEYEQHGGLAYHSQALLNRQPEQIKRQQDFLSSLWGILQARSNEPISRPEWLNLMQAYPFLNRKQPKQQYRLVQQGEKLYLGSESSLSALYDTKLSLLQFTLAKFDTCSSLLVEEVLKEGQAVEKLDHQLQHDTIIEWALATETRRLHVNGYCYTLEAQPKPSWATAIGRDQNGLFVTVPWLNEPRLYWENPDSLPRFTGYGVAGGYNVHDGGIYHDGSRVHGQNSVPKQTGNWSGHEFLGVDEYGLYADLSIKNITQRFRWIEAGSFLMGSPEGEAERINREVQHEVTLTKGFWLGDTTATQALWFAVMGNNPSRFKDDVNNPVENVSWDDAHTFIDQLNQLNPDIHAQLPTEAQWEYACRAGTTTPFSSGNNISPEKVNYNGNLPYAGADKGLYRKKTVAVKSLPANPWGLYEMHGNVWEWCQDYWIDLSKEPATDPIGTTAGSERVVRGGSLARASRRGRSAYRDKRDTDYRSNYIGFRLALGLELKPKHNKKTKIFISYSKHDSHHKNALIKHLARLRDKIIILNDEDILVGEDWSARIKEELYQADIVLYLVSADSMVGYIQQVELPLIEERCNEGRCKLVPIIVDFCYWERLSFAKYSALPEKGIPVTDTHHWANQDQAWVEVVNGIEEIVHALKATY